MRFFFASLTFLVTAAVFLVTSVPATALDRQHYSHQQHQHASNPPIVTSPVSNPPVTSQPSSGGGSSSSSGTVGCTKAINYGYQPLVNGQYDMVLVNSDLSYLKSRGYNCLRLAFYGQNSDVTKRLALIAKSDAFYVIVGNDGDPNSGNYSVGVIAFAQWAQANGIQQVSIGNEASKDSATQAVLASLSCQVRGVFGGIISYDTYLDPAHDEIKAWAANRGCLTKLGLNIYSNYANTASEANSLLGPDGWYASEIGVDMDYYSNISDTQHASMLQTIVNTISAYNVPKFWFSWNAGGDNVALHWALNSQPLTAKIIGL